MIRDPLKDEAYFDQYIKDENQTIEEFKELLEQVISERGIDDKGAQNGFRAINYFHFNKLNAMYSAGYDLEVIRGFVPEVIGSMENAWKGHYLDMLWLLSIGIMLEIDDVQFNRLEKLVRKRGMRDALIDFLLSSRSPAPQESESPLLQENPYRKLIDLIHLDDPAQQARKLKEYLELHWYNGHKDTAWHDNHKHWDDIYTGYWSYESGAVAKILGLDDSGLKGFSYYPYDLVHHKG